MSQEQFEAFRQVVLQESDLLVQLRNVGNHDDFNQILVQMAVSQGYDITVADVTAAVQASRRAWYERPR